jgi:short subunit dehydrogenase-like uncharacterized protein
MLGRLKEGGRVSRQRRSVERNAEDGRLAEGRSVRGVAGRVHKESLAGGWVVPAPTIDPLHVLRSARLSDAYGPDFSYSHFLVTKRLGRTLGLYVGVGLVALFAQLRSTRKLLLKLKAAGSGPSLERRSRSWFRVRFVADHSGGESLITEVRGGDPGYGETAKMLAEAALCLCFDDISVGGGQWTPAHAFGQALIDRLVAAGIEFTVVEPGL